MVDKTTLDKCVVNGSLVELTHKSWIRRVNWGVKEQLIHNFKGHYQNKKIIIAYFLEYDWKINYVQLKN